MKTEDFYREKRVLITGHTGFKGTWMCELLSGMGAKVIGYALQPPTVPNLFALSQVEQKITSIEGDVRDLPHLMEVFREYRPEIVFHMAAQPIVLESYKNPVHTYDVNVMGTVNVLECVRLCDSVKSVVNVTTDKVYKNKEWVWGYRENEELNGYDPYSNSKSCSELVTDCYKKSFLEKEDVAVSTVRAGNVIGGGDFAADRIIPDCVRAAGRKESIGVRNPYSVRPYQHVLEPLTVYLMIAQRQYEDKAFSGSYNVGPDERDCYTTGELVTLFCDKWKKEMQEVITWDNLSTEGPHEANYLKLDCSKLKSVFGWKPGWNVETAIEKVVEWNKAYAENKNISECMEQQIREFLSKQEG